MKCVLAFFVLSVAALAVARPEGRYTDKYDNTNLDDILGNDRLLLSYVKCLLDEGKCTPEGKELRENVPDGLKTNCAHCTLKQKEGVEKFLKHLINHKPELWRPLVVKYDPNNIYSSMYEKKLSELKA